MLSHKVYDKSPGLSSYPAIDDSHVSRYVALADLEPECCRLARQFAVIHTGQDGREYVDLAEWEGWA